MINFAPNFSWTHSPLAGILYFAKFRWQLYQKVQQGNMSHLHVVFVGRVVSGHHGEADQAEAGGGPRLGGRHDYDGTRPPPAGAAAGAEVSH